MNSRMSGWSTRRMPMLAPRRAPPCFTASVAALNTRRNDTGPGRPPAGRAHEVVLRPQPREREAGAAARLVDDGRGLDRLEDLLHRVAHGQHVAGGVLEVVALARVHQRRRVGQEVPLDHHVVEGGGHLVDRGRAAAEPLLGGRDGAGDPPAHLLGRLDDLSPARGRDSARAGPAGPARTSGRPWAGVSRTGRA